jgi:hypothetical protein
VLLRTSDDRLEPVVPHPGVQLKTLDVAAAQVEPFVRGERYRSVQVISPNRWRRWLFSTRN